VYPGVKWKFKTEGEVWSSTVVVGGVVYFGSYDDHLYAVDIETGQEKWRFEMVWYILEAWILATVCM
jgi:outer membrane protein assembly factor BamB